MSGARDLFRFGSALLARQIIDMHGRLPARDARDAS